MRDRVAIIGWGSLIWDLDDLAPHVEGEWFMEAGPRLPLEFSRVSAKRRDALGVCIDPVHGVPCPTHAVLSARVTAAQARVDLARRERAPLDRIGVVCMQTGAREGDAADLVLAWAEAVGVAGVVWTDLRPNFPETRGEAFSLDAAEAHLRGLEGESLDEAVRYIESAPTLTDTPLRRRLAAQDWWRAEAERLARESAR